MRMLFYSLLIWAAFQALIFGKQTKAQPTENEDHRLCQHVDFEACQEKALRTHCSNLCDSWFRVGTQFFSYQDQKKNWLEARKYCISLGGDLAQPKDIAQLSRYLQDEFGYTLHVVWLGATDSIIENQWHWLDGSVLISSAPDGIEAGWATDYEGNQIQPDGRGGVIADTNKIDQDCLYLNPQGVFLGDRECSEPMEFICERPTTM